MRQLEVLGLGQQVLHSTAEIAAPEEAEHHQDTLGIHLRFFGLDSRYHEGG